MPALPLLFTTAYTSYQLDHPLHDTDCTEDCITANGSGSTHKACGCTWDTTALQTCTTHQLREESVSWHGTLNTVLSSWFCHYKLTFVYSIAVCASAAMST